MRYIVDFKNDTDLADIEQYFAENQCEVIQHFSTFEHLYLVESSVEPQNSAIIENIINDEQNSISLLEYNVIYEREFEKTSFPTSSDDHWWKVASANAVDFDLSEQTVDIRGETATVYIVDSGVMSSHPELDGTPVTHLYSFNDDFTDYNGHGTAIASVISGKTTGLTNAAIKSVKIFQSGVPTLQSHILAALESIIVDVAANPTTYPVVNLSWSIPKNTFIEQKIAIMISRGIPVVVSAGNNSVEIENVTPASMPEVCTVGAYNRDLVPCDFSNYTGDISTTPSDTNHGALDIWAPGEHIRAARLDGTVGLVAGTSIAAAIHTAAIAYNSFMFVFGDGSPVPHIADNVAVALAYSADDSGVLSLTGKYSSSDNITSKFHTSFDGENGLSFGKLRSANIVCESGVQVIRRLVLPNIVSQYTIDSLPSGLYLDGDFIRGTVDVTDTLKFTTRIVYVRHTGETMSADINFYLIPENVSLEDSGLDPQVIIQLNAFCNAGSACAASCGIESCIECEGGPKVGGFCVCSPGSCG